PPPPPPLFFSKQTTAYEILIGLVGSEMCIRDSTYANHYSLAPAIEFASAAAALNIMQIGARGHLASIEEITHFISSAKGRE
ncbi:hypothetical protein RAG22_25745, partial [Klebsiella pneumoniae]